MEAIINETKSLLFLIYNLIKDFPEARGAILQIILVSSGLGAIACRNGLRTKPPKSF